MISMVGKTMWFTLLFTLVSENGSLPIASTENGDSAFTSSVKLQSEYDWIIVGGGAAGCAAAATFADSGASILLIERGLSDLDPTMSKTQSADGWPAVANSGTTSTLRILWNNAPFRMNLIPAP